ncbi:transcription/translation regulatory transformer protein RfaH [Vibrio sp. SS-MA-C1-2]|uniref:transcription/translation regulatory transformer protein RfaH n=1 Tax=Vibrio sp. SS-MA-C1-2 TaxID=2908646 RepID=UPI001F247AB2|nr:transcription/translation regulatory transformer protein RfaH [Vibrio sp. SS-MA-C1-2]UJF18758.1 transcription/translation regulatory transformer protein RfaH [Vibrio sp. SS-MA-C1-2]
MKSWYLLYCKRSELQRAIVNLQRQGVETYIPEVRVEKIQRGKKMIVVEPLFPNYVFVHFDIEILHTTAVRSTRGVVDFVRSGTHPQNVTEDLITGLKERSKIEYLKDGSLPSQGEIFILNQAPYIGIEAIYMESDGEKRSFMLINIINQQVKVSIDNKELANKKEIN